MTSITQPPLNAASNDLKRDFLKPRSMGCKGLLKAENDVDRVVGDGDLELSLSFKDWDNGRSTIWILITGISTSRPPS